MCATSEIGTAYPSGACEVSPFNNGGGGGGGNAVHLAIVYVFMLSVPCCEICKRFSARLYFHKAS
jgi:hypothetical protein